MRRAVIIDAVRTPGGKRLGQLSGWHSVDLAAEALKGVLEPSGLDPALIDDVFMGCVTQVSGQACNVGRNAVLAAGWPESVPATTIDRQCGSSQQALHFAAQAIMSGFNDVIVAAGVESMSSVPMFSNMEENPFETYGPTLRARYDDRESFGERGLVLQGTSAELIADQWKISREEMDVFGLMSQERAAKARDNGVFDAEIVKVASKRRDPNNFQNVEIDGVASTDEGIRLSSLEKLASLKPAFRPDGKVTAGNSSQIADGASASLVMSEEHALALGLRPRAILKDFAVVGVDPVTMLSGPIPATRKLLGRAGLTIDEIDLFEVNEAFACVVLAWAKELGADLGKTNVNGGGIALGHPLGASGTKLMATLVHELERTGGRYGVLTMCEGGGMANATLIERYIP